MSFNIFSEVMHLIGSELWISTLHHGRVEFHGQHVEQSQWPFWPANIVVFLNSLHYLTRSPLSVITISGKHYNWNNRLTISLRNWLNLNNETDWSGAPVNRLPRYSLLVERYSMRLHLMVRQLEDYILWTWFWDVAHVWPIRLRQAEAWQNWHRNGNRFRYLDNLPTRGRST